MKKLGAILLFTIVFLSNPLAADENKKKEKSSSLTKKQYLVDFSKCQIDGVDLSKGYGAIVKKIGKKRILKKSEDLEAKPHEVQIVLFGQEKVYRHWNALSFKSPSFKTKEGLGIGSPISEFSKVYGKGRKVEYGSIRFQSQEPYYVFSIRPVTGSLAEEKGQVASEIWVWCQSYKL